MLRHDEVVLSSLERAYAFTLEVPRVRGSHEPHWRINRAYFDLIFAWAFAQAGNLERAHGLLRASTARLPKRSAVHGAVRAAYAARIFEPVGRSPWTPLKLDLSRLQPFDQYKVSRLLKHSAILSRVESWDPAATFKSGTIPEADLTTRILQADGANDLESVHKLLLEFFHRAPRTATGASLMFPSRRVGLTTELAQFIRASPASPQRTAALVVLGESSIGQDPAPSLEGTRSVIGALALVGRRSEAAALIEKTWRDVASDSLSTNTHFTLSALCVCETLVLSVLRHELALGNRAQLEPRDDGPSLQPALEPDPDLCVDLDIILGALASRRTPSGKLEQRFAEQREAVRRLAGTARGPGRFVFGPEAVPSIIPLLDDFSAVLSDLRGTLADGVEDPIRAQSLSDVERTSRLFYRQLRPELRGLIPRSKRVIKKMESICARLNSLLLELPDLSTNEADDLETVLGTLASLVSRTPEGFPKVEEPADALITHIEKEARSCIRLLEPLSPNADLEFTIRGRETILRLQSLLHRIAGRAISQ